jgi:hypothetical protein
LISITHLQFSSLLQRLQTSLYALLRSYNTSMKNQNVIPSNNTFITNRFEYSFTLKDPSFKPTAILSYFSVSNTENVSQEGYTLYTKTP